MRLSKSAIIVLGLVVATALPPQIIAAQELVAQSSPAPDWRETYAYNVGMQAFIYGYPSLKLASMRQAWIDGPKTDLSLEGGNVYNHYRKLSDHTYRYGNSMNRDTLYSVSFSDVSKEPLIYTLPANPDGRYMSIEFTDWYTDAFAYISPRDHAQNKPVSYMIYYGEWNRSVPTGVDKVIKSPTPWIIGLGRTYTTNTNADLRIAHAVQDGMTIFQLSEWGKDNPQKTRPVRDFVRNTQTTDELSAMKSISALLIENPPPKRDEALMVQFGLVGIGPKAILSIDQMDAATKRGLVRAQADAMKLLEAVAEDMGSVTNQRKKVNGWVYNPQNWGRMAENGDFLGRAATQSLAGGMENWVEEAVKLRSFHDNGGAKLNGANTYMLKFSQDQIPKVKSFWSITLYDNEFNLVDPGTGKYAVRSIDPDLVFGPDGSLTILLSPQKPKVKGLNWLPTPQNADFNLFFRAYLPAQDLINQSYVPPPITRVP